MRKYSIWTLVLIILLVTVKAQCLPNCDYESMDISIINTDELPPLQQGQTSLEPGQQVLINNVHIYAPQERLDIYFDGKKHQGSYISVGLNEKIFILSGTYEAFFLPQNPFLEIESNEFLVILAKDLETTIQNTPSLPKVTIISSSQESLFLNGKNRIIFSDTKLKWVTKEKGVDSSMPLILSIQNKANKNILNDQKIIFDNAGNYVFVQEDFKETDLTCKDCILDLTQKRLLYDSVTLKTGKTVASSGELEQKGNLLANLTADLNELTNSLSESIGHITIASEDELAEKCQSRSALGCATSEGNIILRSEVVGDKETLYHESAHTLTFQIENQENQQAAQEFITYQVDLKNKYSLENPPQVSGNSITPSGTLTQLEEVQLISLYKNSQENLKTTFISTWNTTAGPVYGKDLATPPVTWLDGTDEPRNGCERAYGCSDLYEDIATWTEPFAIDNFAFLNKILQPGYDSRNKEKVRLLCQRDFLTTEDCCNVTIC